MPTTANTINYYVAADGTLRDGSAGSIAQTPRIYYGTEYAVTLSFPPSTIAEGDQLQVAVNRTRTFFSSASATGDAPVAAVAKHEVTAAEAAAQAVTLTLSTNTRAMIDQVNGIDHPVRGFFGVHVLKNQSFVTLAVADAFMMSVESGPDAISPSLPVVDYPTREEAEALTDRSEAAAERAEEAAKGIVPPLQLDSPPTTSTVGSVGQLAIWRDAEANKDHLYHLCYITEGESATLYHWEECVLESQRNVAGGFAGLDSNAKVPDANLPRAGATSSERGVVFASALYGISVSSQSRVTIEQASNNYINNRSNAFQPITSNNLDYAVRSVLPNVTVIPAATSDYSLVDSSAITNNHSMTYRHEPQSSSVYRLPAVAANSTVLHEIVLSIKFSSTVLTYEFQDSAGNTLVPLPLNGDIEAGSVVTFLCRYNPLLSQWVIYPVMDGKEAE